MIDSSRHLDSNPFFDWCTRLDWRIINFFKTKGEVKGLKETKIDSLRRYCCFISLRLRAVNEWCNSRYSIFAISTGVKSIMAPCSAQKTNVEGMLTWQHNMTTVYSVYRHCTHKGHDVQSTLLSEKAQSSRIFRKHSSYTLNNGRD
jgi:hypothetical protein